MKLTTEKELRESIQKQLKSLLKQSTRLVEKQEIDLNVDLSDVPGIPPILKKMTDGGISPQKFAALDSEVDQSEDESKQAAALLVFALNYADKSPEDAITLLRKAINIAPKLQKKIDSAKKKE